MGNMSNKDKKKPEPKTLDEMKEELRKDEFGLYVNTPNYAETRAAIINALPRNAVVQGKPTIGRVK